MFLVSHLLFLFFFVSRFIIKRKVEWRLGKRTKNSLQQQEEEKIEDVRKKKLPAQVDYKMKTLLLGLSRGKEERGKDDR